MDVRYSNIGAEPISLIELKNYLKIDFDEDDTLLEQMITATRELAEEFCDRSFVIKTIELTALDYDYEFMLPYPDHDQVTEVKINDTDYTETVFINGLTEKTLGLPVVTNNMIQSNSGLYVKYTTLGYCPSGVKLAIMKNISEAYDNRGNANEEKLTELSENAAAMLWRFVRI